MKLKCPNINSIETIGYARRSDDYPNMSYIGWDRGTVFDLELVYRVDLEMIHQAHKERYDELRSELFEAIAEQERQCERIRELEQYISSVIVAAQRDEDYNDAKFVEDDAVSGGDPQMVPDER